MGLTLKQAKQKYIEAQTAYYEGHPIMSDPTFDRLEDWIKSKDPKWVKLSKTGVSVGAKKEVKLPQFMPSLNKVYPDEVDSWFNKFVRPNWAYMAKLDGNSVFVEYVKGKPKRLITRGDGEFGKDISYFIPFLPIPQEIDHPDRLQLRCEAIIRKSDFVKYETRFDNPRNMVAGLLNRKTADPALADIRLVVLGVYHHPLVDGLKKAFKLGFETVSLKIDKPRREEHYLHLFKSGKYEADGCVICEPDFQYVYENADKPKAHLIAYKENNEVADSTVTEVIYQISSAGRIIPKIRIEPVSLSGAVIEYCTSHNAKWMINRKLGVGSKIRVTRSGDVIPKIIDVLSEGQIVYPKCEYEMKGVHFVATSRSKEQVVNILTKFVSTLGIENMKAKTFETLYDCGVINLHRLLELAHTPNVCQRLQSKFGERKGLAIYQNLQTIVNTRWDLSKLMVASCVFNSIGEKRLTALQELDFDLLALCEWDPIDIKISIISPGIGESLAEQIAQGLADFKTFWVQNRKLLAKPLPYKKKQKIRGCLEGMFISFTGYRDKGHEQIIVNNGGEIINFGAKTNILLYREGGKKSSKIERAGSKAMTFQEFSERYSLRI